MATSDKHDESTRGGDSRGSGWALIAPTSLAHSHTHPHTHTRTHIHTHTRHAKNQAPSTCSRPQLGLGGLTLRARELTWQRSLVPRTSCCCCCLTHVSCVCAATVHKSGDPRAGRDLVPDASRAVVRSAANHNGIDLSLIHI